MKEKWGEQLIWIGSCGEDLQHPWEDLGRTSEHQGDKSFLQKCFALHLMLCAGLQSAFTCFIYMGRLLSS